MPVLLVTGLFFILSCKKSDYTPKDSIIINAYYHTPVSSLAGLRPANKYFLQVFYYEKPIFQDSSQNGFNLPLPGFGDYIIRADIDSLSDIVSLTYKGGDININLLLK